MKAYKGFDKNMQCRGFQFEEGKTYREENAVLCRRGFHACENPLNVFDYYPPSQSVYHEVEMEEVSEERGDDTKVCAKQITIGARLDIAGMVKAAVDFVFSKADWSKKRSRTTGYHGAASDTGYQGAASATGDHGAASATGDQGAASATGYQGAASATGCHGAASATGEEGVAVSLGIKGKAKASLGCWITLAEWNRDEDNTWHRICVKTGKVDGGKIKPDTWYSLVNDEFVEVE